MVGGAGGIAHAAAAMARMDREMRRRLAESKARRRHMKDMHNGRKAGHPPAPPARSDLACAWMCGTCGLLADSNPKTCPGCQSLYWLDLGDHAVADTVRESEDRARRQAPQWLQVCLIAAASAGVLLLWLILGRAWSVLLVGVPAVTVFWLAGLRSIAWAVAARLPHQPARWRFPIAPGALPGTGAAEPNGPVLQAPFSGTDCVAWRVGVMFDVEGDYRPPQWALAEARSSAISLDGSPIEADGIVFEGPLRPISLEDAEEAGLNLGAFLRERGLFAGDGSYLLFEACLPAGTAVVCDGAVLRPASEG
ncbi:MAG: hypothetical protein GY898_00415 [Proteobacteria bacterium]|nr:hypothetical protein [Pseudomonadota bacterium]